MSNVSEPTLPVRTVPHQTAADQSHLKRALKDLTVLLGHMRWPTVVIAGIGLVAYTDWRVETSMSVGYLYLVPLILAGNTIHQRKWLLCLVALAAVLREIFGPFQHSGWPLLVRSVIAPSVYALVALFVHRVHERQRRLADLVDQQRRQLNRDLDDAAAVQQALLPDHMPNVSGWELSARHSPARVVSGDTFDVFWDEAAKELTVVIADVTGKGAAAAMLMPVVQATVRRLRAKRHAPEALAQRINDMIAALTDRPLFVSLVYAVIDTDTGDVAYVNMGHPPPVVMRGPSDWTWLSEGGTIAGAFAGTRYQSGQVHMDAGDALILYTDGVTEAENMHGDPFSERGVADAVSRYRELSADLILEKLQGAVEAFRADSTSRDDMTLIVVRRQHVATRSPGIGGVDGVA